MHIGGLFIPLNQVTITIVMSVQLKAWIRQVGTLSDTALEEELKLINKNSVNAFARAIGRIHRPESDPHTFRSGDYEAHPHADTINLSLSVGEAALSSINSDTPSDNKWVIVPLWTSMQESKY